MPPDDRDFVERLERLTWVVARAMLVGVPVFVLVLFAFLGVYDTVGPLIPLLLAGLAAAGATVSVERVLGRRRGGDGPTTDAGRLRAPPRPYRRLLYAGAAVAAVYVAFILMASGRGA